MVAVDDFLKIDGIEIISFPIGGSGKGSSQDFSFRVPVNKSSPKLFLARATGEHSKSASQTCQEAGKTQQEYLNWKCIDLLIFGYVTSGNTGSDVVPIDQVTFNFTKIDVSYAHKRLPVPSIAAISAAQPQGWQKSPTSRLRKG